MRLAFFWIYTANVLMVNSIAKYYFEQKTYTDISILHVVSRLPAKLLLF